MADTKTTTNGTASSDAAPTAQQVATTNEGAATPVPFNPFTHLTAEEVTSLAGSFNKQWRDTHALTMAMAQTEHKCSEIESLFFAWLKAEATAIVDRNNVSSAVSYITNLLQGVAFPASSEVTLGLIETRYAELKASLRKAAGIRIRDYAAGQWQSETASAILSKVYAKLGVSEKEWMRK